jgi:hypothetical protein
LRNDPGFDSVKVIDDDLGRPASAAWPALSLIGSSRQFVPERLVPSRASMPLASPAMGAAGTFFSNSAAWSEHGNRHRWDLRSASANDLLLLGIKGSTSEFELGVIRARMLDAKHGNSLRSDLRITVPIRYLWHREIGSRF